MRIPTAAILGAALLSAGCDIRVDEGGIRSLGITEGRAEDVWTRTYTLAPGGRLEITGQNGEIEVRAADGSQVDVRAEREVRAGSDEMARALLEKLRMHEEASPDAVRITAEGEQGDWAPPGMAQRGRVRVRYRVSVPAGLTLVLRTQNGGIRLDGVSGRLTVATSNGSITADNISGAVDAETVNGGVRVDLTALTEDVRLASTNGAIRLDLPRDAKATIDASWVNGRLTLDDAFGVAEPDRRERRYTASLNGGGPTISARTVNGGIRIRARGGRATD